MKFYKPLFSIIVILIQLILSVKEYFKIQEWKKEKPELDSLINLNITYDSLFLFIFEVKIFKFKLERVLLVFTSKIIDFLSSFTTDSESIYSRVLAYFISKS